MASFPRASCYAYIVAITCLVVVLTLLMTCAPETSYGSVRTVAGDSIRLDVDFGWYSVRYMGSRETAEYNATIQYYDPCPSLVESTPTASGVHKGYLASQELPITLNPGSTIDISWESRTPASLSIVADSTLPPCAACTFIPEGMRPRIPDAEGETLASWPEQVTRRQVSWTPNVNRSEYILRWASAGGARSEIFYSIESSLVRYNASEANYTCSLSLSTECHTPFTATGCAVLDRPLVSCLEEDWDNTTGCVVYVQLGARADTTRYWFNVLFTPITIVLTVLGLLVMFHNHYVTEDDDDDDIAELTR